MHSDASLLASVPDFVSVGGLLKALPSTEGDRRFLFLEASNEGLDQQNEIVAAKALGESAEYFKRYGNIDLEHYTMLGKPNPAQGRPGMPGHELYEIGRPIDVRQDGARTFVKAEIYSGDGPAAENANTFWHSITGVNPPHRWYPSVAGAIPKDGRKVVVDKGGIRKAIVTKVRWSNIGMSKTPVNQHVQVGDTMPFGAFAKCWTAVDGGFDLSKALEASYATDAVGKTGGAALGMQSLDGGGVKSYWDFRHNLSAAISSGQVAENPGSADLLAYAQTKFNLSADEAAEWVARFMRDLKNGLNKRRSQS